MDYLRRIINYFQNRNSTDGIVSFPNEQKIFTLHTDEDGMIIMTAFTPEQYSMIKDIIELTDSSFYNVIVDITKDENITSIKIDPKEL